jgi:hypothetical protein
MLSTYGGCYRHKANEGLDPPPRKTVCSGIAVGIRGHVALLGSCSASDMGSDDATPRHTSPGMHDRLGAVFAPPELPGGVHSRLDRGGLA